MTESAPPQGGVTPAGSPVPPGEPVPAPAGAPQQPDAKGGGGRRIIGIVVTVVVLAAIGIFRFVLPAIEDSKWKEGACLDYYPTGLVEFNIDAKVVDCADGSAKSRIVGVFGSDATIERNCEPLGSLASVTRDDKTYCIVEV
jgi:hypothetical protein